MEILYIDIIKYLAIFFVGMFLHWLMLSPKIKKLTDTIDALVDAIRRLENRAENFEQLRSDVFELEKRVSTNESEIKVVKSQSNFNMQSIMDVD